MQKHNFNTIQTTQCMNMNIQPYFLNETKRNEQKIIIIIESALSKYVVVYEWVCACVFSIHMHGDWSHLLKDEFVLTGI